MYNIKPQLRLNIIQHYLGNGVSLKVTAQKFNVHYLTVFKWVKLYNEQGEERLLSTYKRPWNRARKELEEKIVLLKENDPRLTVRKVKEILEKDGITISIKGIWGIWKRYGYAGFKKGEISTDFTEDFSWTREATRKFEQTKEIFNLGNTEKSAQILNSIPVLPKNELLLQIPDCKLNLRRRVEKMPSLFGKIPVQSYLNKVRNLYKECMKRNLYYSALRLGIFEVMALSWAAEPMNMLKKIKELKNILNGKGNYHSYLLFAPRTSLLISEGIAYAHLSKIKKASKTARICRKLLIKQKYISPSFMIDLGALYMSLEDFKKAEYWYVKCLQKASGAEKKMVKNRLADIFYMKGEYKKAIHTLKNADVSERSSGWGTGFRELIFQAMWFLINGMPHKAISLCTEILFLLKKEEVHVHIVGTNLIIASAYCSLGEKAKAESVLREVFPFVKTKLKKKIIIFKILLSRTAKITSRIPLNENLLPSEKLAFLLRKGDYLKALRYTEKKSIMIYLHKYIFFFPEVITRIIEQGKPTGLPKKIVKLPVFNKNIPVYNINFLGNLIVYKNQNCLKVHPVRKKIQVVSSDSFKSTPDTSLVSRARRKFSNGVKLTPKDTAFLIHLAFRAEEPGKEISLRDICQNFWKNNPNQNRNLSHLLVRIKKELKIPAHLLEISSKKDNLVLINRGIHFITDYQEFEQILASATAFLKADEWGFAKKEYLRAFKLFRGEPFRKMYDNWSESIRRVILNKLESEVLHFAKCCLEHGNPPNRTAEPKSVADAKKVLEKVLTIIPHLTEIENMVKRLNS